MRIFIFCLFLAGPALVIAQKVTVSGEVTDADNGESLIGVNIFADGTQEGTATNSYGFYSLRLEPGEYTLVYQYLGYDLHRKKVRISKDVVIDVILREQGQALDAIEVTTRGADANVKSVEMSVTEVTTKEIEKVPQLLGEVDVIRTLTLLPGVSTVGEGANGFNVRGGNVDQNLILLDGAPVFNSSHLFGFFSVFNADAVQSFKLYKGGIPAQYGGRLSSVLDVRQREGNSKRFSGRGGLGILSSRATFEGPIIKDKMSFLVSGRRSYGDVFTNLSSDESINSSILYFYDFNTKINYRINKKHRLYLSGYFGRDALGIRDFVNFNWGNATATLRWNWTINNRLFSNLTAVYSDYDYTIGSGNVDNPDEGGFGFTLDSRLRNYKLEQKFTWFASSDYQLDFGYDATFYDIMPGRSTFNDGSSVTETTLQSEYGLEPSLFISAEQSINANLTLQYGIRYSSFYNFGPRDMQLYDGTPSEENVVGTQQYARGEVIESYTGLQGFEPRFSVNYALDEKQSLKASYNRTRQYIQLVSNTTSPTPVDIWRPAGKYIRPATANQVAGGYFRNLRDNVWEFSVEVFYKYFNDIIDYRDGAELFVNDNIETSLLTGEGRAYGLELLLRKQRGRLQGWIGYTLSRAELIVRGDDPFSSINQGDWYPSNFDRLHDLSIVVSYELTKKWDVGGSFIYQTGRPVTFPVGRAEVGGLVVPVNTMRNSNRIPDFHRLDLSANYNPSVGKNKRWESSWSFGLFNVYARRNPFSVFFQNDPQNPQVNQAVRLAIFGTIIPSVTYNFKF